MAIVAKVSDDVRQTAGVEGDHRAAASRSGRRELAEVRQARSDAGRPDLRAPIEGVDTGARSGRRGELAEAFENQIVNVFSHHELPESSPLGPALHDVQQHTVDVDARVSGH